MPKEKSYRWANPYEWIEHKVDSGEWSQGQIRSELLALAQQADPDDLQDLYQSEMDADGYFEELEG